LRSKNNTSNHIGDEWKQRGDVIYLEKEINGTISLRECWLNNNSNVHAKYVTKDSKVILTVPYNNYDIQKIEIEALLLVFSRL